MFALRQFHMPFLPNRASNIFHRTNACVTIIKLPVTLPMNCMATSSTFYRSGLHRHVVDNDCRSPCGFLGPFPSIMARASKPRGPLHACE